MLRSLTNLKQMDRRHLLGKAAMTTRNSQPSFCIGPSVDRYLKSEGAIAQALDRNRIALSSSALAMSKAERRWIVLHEMAHVQQLARGGNDPVGSLEDEAWEAAEAWSLGKPFRIRGRARQRLNAVAIISNDTHGANAARWYTTNPLEPIGGSSVISVKSQVLLDPATISLEVVLDTIIAQKDKEILLVSHGYDEGLMMPVYMVDPKTRSDYGAISANLLKLASTGVMRNGVKSQTIADDQVFPGGTTAKVKQVREKMEQVQKMNLDHVAFRACDMGKKRETLDAFRDFFGAKSVSAPRSLDVYGTVATSMTPDLKAWAKPLQDKQGYRCWIDNKVAFAFKLDPKITINFKLLSRAVNRSALVDWMRKHLADTLAADNSFTFHGVLELLSAKDTPMIQFVRDQGFLVAIINHAGD